MVTTRNHDNTPAKRLEYENPKENGSAKVRGTKRKVEGDEVSKTRGRPTEKRKRAALHVRNDVASITKIPTDDENKNAKQSVVSVVIPASIEPKHHIQASLDVTNVERSEEAKQASEVSNIANSVPSLPPPISKVSDAHAEDNEIYSSMELQEGNDNKQTELTKSTRLDSSESPSRPDKKRKKQLSSGIKQPAKPTTTSPSISHPKTIHPPPKPPSTLPQPKSTHKRFSSQEPTLPSSPPPRVTNEPKPLSPSNNLSSDDEEDDDEAPETVTATVGQTLARAKALDEAKAATQLERERKRKRKERDERLKAQAKTTKRNGKSGASNAKTARMDEAVGDEDTPPPQPSTKPSNTKPPLPPLLPSHILASPTPPPTLPPLPSTFTPNPPPNQKRKFPTLDPKPPKDIKKGNVRIRVLEEGNAMLPPKASMTGRSIRERWLMGRGVERRGWSAGGKKGGGGFVRR